MNYYKIVNTCFLCTTRVLICSNLEPHSSVVPVAISLRECTSPSLPPMSRSVAAGVPIIITTGKRTREARLPRNQCEVTPQINKNEKRNRQIEKRSHNKDKPFQMFC